MPLTVRAALAHLCAERWHAAGDALALGVFLAFTLMGILGAIGIVLFASFLMAALVGGTLGLIAGVWLFDKQVELDRARNEREAALNLLTWSPQ